jgi:hypothetical protein
MIRKAQVADLPGIMRVGRRLQAQTPYRDIHVDVATVGSTLGHCINNAFGFAMVATTKGEITGFMLGAAVPLWFCRKRSATDIVTYAENAGDGYKMIKAFIQWAWAIPGVVEITMGQSSGVDTDRSGILYERAGLIRVGNLFTAVREASGAEVAA